MDRIRFKCACGKVLNAPVSAAGKKAPCPVCKAIVEVPAADGATAAGLAAPSPSAPPPAAAPAAPDPTATRQFREWVKRFVLERVLDHASEALRCTPDIPEKKLAGASAAYAAAAAGEQALVLFDDTVFGSAKAGLLITDRRILWEGSFTDPQDIAFRDLEGAAFDGKRILVKAHGREHPLQMAQMKAEDLQIVGLVLQGIAQEVRGVAPDAPDTRPAEEQVAEIILQIMRPYATGALHVTPDIPAGKVRGAREAYLDLQADERLLVLFDDTVFSSAKTGFCLTDRRLVSTTHGQPWSFGYADLEALQIEETAIRLRAGLRRFHLKFIQWGKREIEAMVTVLLRLQQRFDKILGRGDFAPGAGVAQAREMEFLRMGTVMLVKDNHQPCQEQGVLALTPECLMWRPKGEEESCLIPLERIVSVQKPLLGQMVDVEMDIQGRRLAMTFYVEKGAKEWVEAVNRAVFERRQQGFLGQ